MNPENSEIKVVIMTITRDIDAIPRRVQANILQNKRRVTETLGWECRWELLSGFSHVPLARSSLLQTVRKKYPNAERFVFWDDDQIILGDNGLERLVAHDVDVVGTLVVSRRRECHLQTTLNPASFENGEIDLLGPPQLIEIYPGADSAEPEHRECTGFGVIAFKPQVIDKIIEHYKMPDVYLNDQKIKHVFADLTVDMCGRPTILGEDYNFCVRAATVGARLFVEPTLMIGHLGNYYFTILDLGRIRDQCPATLPETVIISSGRDDKITTEAGGGSPSQPKGAKVI